MKGRTELEFWRIENRFESAQKRKSAGDGGELVAVPTNPPHTRVRGEREREKNDNII
jgi:hypothetical protein